jgi:hypothetical protein
VPGQPITPALEAAERIASAGLVGEQARSGEVVAEAAGSGCVRVVEGRRGVRRSPGRSCFEGDGFACGAAGSPRLAPVSFPVLQLARPAVSSRTSWTRASRLRRLILVGKRLMDPDRGYCRRPHRFVHHVWPANPAQLTLGWRSWRWLRGGAGAAEPRKAAHVAALLGHRHPATGALLVPWFAGTSSRRFASRRYRCTASAVTLVQLTGTGSARRRQNALM